VQAESVQQQQQGKWKADLSPNVRFKPLPGHGRCGQRDEVEVEVGRQRMMVCVMVSKLVHQPSVVLVVIWDEFHILLRLIVALCAF